jgi:hypothetical protein
LKSQMRNTPRQIQKYIHLQFLKKSSFRSVTPSACHLRFIASYLTRNAAISTSALEPSAMFMIAIQRFRSTSRRGAGRSFPRAYRAYGQI